MQESSDFNIIKEIAKVDQEEGLHLHKYHQDLIFNIFKEYYRSFEEQKAHNIKHYYQDKIRR